MRTLSRSIAVFVASLMLAFSFSAPAQARTHHHHKLDKIHTVAKAYGWDEYQVSEWKIVIYDEDRTWSLTASNGTCYGLGQLIGGPSEYYSYPHGSPWTEIGQLWGMAGYIKGRYRLPSNAVQHEQDHHWY